MCKEIIKNLYIFNYYLIQLFRTVYSSQLEWYVQDSYKLKIVMLNLFQHLIVYIRFRYFLSEILHSDAGSQYTSEAYKSTIGKYHGIQSMSDVGKCYDNARMESFFATLKKEKLYKIKTEKMTVEQVKTAVFRYIMVYYNRKRITTVNPDGLPPSIYRERFEVQSSVA